METGSKYPWWLQRPTCTMDIQPSQSSARYLSPEAFGRRLQPMTSLSTVIDWDACRPPLNLTGWKRGRNIRATQGQPLFIEVIDFLSPVSSFQSSQFPRRSEATGVLTCGLALTLFKQHWWFWHRHLVRAFDRALDTGSIGSGYNHYVPVPNRELFFLWKVVVWCESGPWCDLSQLRKTRYVTFKLHLLQKPELLISYQLQFELLFL